MIFWVLIIVFVSAILVGSIAMFCVTATAPLGYQDDAGFHFGVPTPAGPRIVRAQASIEGAEQRMFAAKLFDDFARQGANAKGAC